MLEQKRSEPARFLHGHVERLAAHEFVRFDRRRQLARVRVKDDRHRAKLELLGVRVVLSVRGRLHYASNDRALGAALAHRREACCREACQSATSMTLTSLAAVPGWATRYAASSRSHARARC